MTRRQDGPGLKKDKPKARRGGTRHNHTFYVSPDFIELAAEAVELETNRTQTLDTSFPKVVANCLRRGIWDATATAEEVEEQLAVHPIKGTRRAHLALSDKDAELLTKAREDATSRLGRRVSVLETVTLLLRRAVSVMDDKDPSRTKR